MRRTEGWAAGLRRAALSLAGQPDPEGFAAEFSGTERTVAQYLLAEVLDHQSDSVRRLLLRTSVCERVSGELADLLTGGSGGERILQDLENAGAFVVSLDGRRSWFRYHPLFADLLQLELRRAEPAERAALLGAAAGWYGERGYPVEAVRHAQAARDWDLAARLLSDHFLGLILDGQSATAHELLARFPAEMVDADPKLAVLLAADELLRRSLEAAERHLARAERQMTSVPADRRGRFEVNLAIMRLSLAQRRGDLPAVVEEAQRLLASAESATGPSLDADTRVAFWLEAIARDALGDPAAAGHALEQALDLAEPDGAIFAFVLHPAPGLLQRHARRGTSHAALIAEILSLPGRPGGMGSGQPSHDQGGRGIIPPRVTEPLSGCETRVLRFLSTNLSAPEISGQLSVSVNTVRTHMRHVYEKLGAHSRAEAVDRARALGLLAPSPRRP